jgi:hypothetical protein
MKKQNIVWYRVKSVKVQSRCARLLAKRTEVSGMEEQEKTKVELERKNAPMVSSWLSAPKENAIDS